MGGHVDGLYFDPRAICWSIAGCLPLRVCNEADVSTQKRRDKKDTGAKVDRQIDEIEREADERRGDRFL